MFCRSRLNRCNVSVFSPDIRIPYLSETKRTYEMNERNITATATTTTIINGAQWHNKHLWFFDFQSH